MTRKVQWNNDAQPLGSTLDQILYQIRCADAGEGLLMDAVTPEEITEDSDGILTFDALVSPYARLERKMELLRGIMERAGDKVKPVAMQITEPFKQRGVAHVAVIFELSDGQTVSIYFHNPDGSPGKMAPTDEVISWKWLLNKKDITIVVAPERGSDLNVREVARRIMRLSEKNSAAFQRANAKRAERMGAIQGLKDEIATLETELAAAQHELEVAKVAVEDGVGKVSAPQKDPARLWVSAEGLRSLAEQRGIAVSDVSADPADDEVLGATLAYGAVTATLVPMGDGWHIQFDTTKSTIDTRILSDALDFFAADAKKVTPAKKPAPATSPAADVPPAALEAPQQPGEQALIDAHLKAWGEEAAQINAAVAAINWGGIIDGASAEAEIQKLRAAVGSLRGGAIGKARDALEAIGIKSWDSRVNGVIGTPEFKSHGDAMGAYQAAIDKIQAIAKEKLIEAGKREFAELPVDAPIEDVARAIFKKRGLLGSGEHVAAAIKAKNAELAWDRLRNLDNKASAEIFERTTGIKLAKTIKGRRPQIDAWASITPEKRAELEAAKDAAWQAKERESNVRDAWGWIGNMQVRGSDGAIFSGQQYLLQQFAEGYDEVGAFKRGAAVQYGLRKDNGTRFVKSKNFNAFLKAAAEFGGLRQALELVGADIPAAAPAQQAGADKIAAVDAAYRFASASDEFKLWLHESLGKTDYSPFATAQAMDEAAKRHGAGIEWGEFGDAALDDTGLAVASLQQALEVAKTNEPINRAAGNYAQADLEVDVTASIQEAIAALAEAEIGVTEDEIGGEFEAFEFDEEDFDEADEWAAMPEADEDDVALDGDFKGHPFRGNQHRKASRSSGAAVGASIRAKGAERRGDKKAAKQAHRSAYHAHAAALHDASTKKAKSYHRKMAKFHARHSGVDATLDSALALDGVDDDGYVGKIKKAGEVVGRVDLGGDGKAMVFVGAAGDERVTYTRGGESIRALYSDDDAPSMVGWLFEGLQAKEQGNAAPAVVLTGKELGDFPDTEEGKKALREAAISRLEVMRDEMNADPGKGMDCPILGAKVYLRGRGIRELKRFGANPVKLKLVAGIRALIGAASEKQWKANYKKDKKPRIEGYFTLSALAEVDGKAFPVSILVEKDDQGLFHYDFLLDRQQTKEALVRSASNGVDGAPTSKAGDQPETDSTTMDAAGQSGRMVINLFIEGEDPEEVEVEEENVSEVAASEDPQKAADRALFQSVIDGTIQTADGEGILSPQVAELLEPAFYRHQADPEMVSLFEKAADAYQAAMLEATKDLA